MKDELILMWMDKLIYEWYQMRLIRTLADGGGDEFATNIGFNYDYEFHLDFGTESDKEGIERMAAVAGSEVVEEDHSDEFISYSFKYRGFKFFALDRR